MQLRSPAISVFVCLLFGSMVVAADGDWPQWRGPQRDGHAASQSLLQNWPEGGPRLKWSFDAAGRGYSSAAVADGRLFTMGARDGQCWVICLDAAKGEKLWETSIGRDSKDDDYLHGWGGGPRSTPTVDGDSLYAISDVGALAKLDLQNGEVRWSVDFLSFPGAEIPKWGFSESPLIDGDRVVVTPGGENFMVALSKGTGEKVWSSQGLNETAQYVSIMKHTFADVPFYTTACKSGLYGFHAETGEQLFQTPVTGNGVAVIPTPIPDGKHLYHTSDYGAGNVLMELQVGAAGELSARQVYHIDNKSMQNHHGGVVLVDGVIYGFTKADGGQWMAQDLLSGDTLWSKKLRGNRSGSIAYADGRLYCYNDGDGSLYLVQPQRDDWQAVGMLTLPRQTSLDRGKGAIWAHPVIAGQTLFVRDQDLVYAYDIAR